MIAVIFIISDHGIGCTCCIRYLSQITRCVIVSIGGLTISVIRNRRYPIVGIIGYGGRSTGRVCYARYLSAGIGIS